MGDIVPFPSERVALARLRRAYYAELERVAELDWLADGRKLHVPARHVVRAYFQALFREAPWQSP
jgi:hypothetical protein